MTTHLTIQVAYQIQKPVHEVYEAIVNPQHMTQYFISKSSGRMEPNTDLVWEFPEFEGDAPIRVGALRKDEYISFYWEIDGEELLAEITLTPYNTDETVVSITEKEKKNDEKGLQWLKGNTEGWTNFLCCLKAYLEYGINLRKGGFEFRKKQS